MKTKKLRLLASGALVIALAGIPQLVMAAFDSATVNIKGYVKDKTCTLTGAGNVTEFTLPPVSVRDFKDNGDIGNVDIPIEFKDCGIDTQGVTVKVSGELGGSAGAFKNTLDGDDSQGGATGVGINFYDTDGTTLIQAGSDVEAKDQAFTKETTLHYRASYTKVADEVKAGKVNTVITLTFTYQ